MKSRLFFSFFFYEMNFKSSFFYCLLNHIIHYSTVHVQARLLLTFNSLKISLFCWWSRHKSLSMNPSAKCLKPFSFFLSVWLFSIHSVSAYAIPLNPSMLFIFSIAFGRLRFLYQWPDMFGYKSVVFLFWHRRSAFSYTILTSNTGCVVCKGHLWRSILLTDGLAAGVVRPNNTVLIDCGIKKWHKNVSLQCCLFQEGWCEMILKLDLLLI